MSMTSSESASMTHQHMPAIFVADAPGLDFLNSIATPIDTPVDWIDSGEGLLSWLEQAHLVPKEALDALRANAVPGEMDGVAAQARNLREWFRTFVRDHKGRSLDAGYLDRLGPLNRLLERDEGYGRIVAEENGKPAGLALRTMRRWRSPESLLVPIAEVLATLVCDEDFSTVKACEGPACTLLFADHTRGRARRWCSMAICGNRAKQAAHRNRARSPSA
jgi:predicted RNA-binding Zn ribbon-like protein